MADTPACGAPVQGASLLCPPMLDVNLPAEMPRLYVNTHNEVQLTPHSSSLRLNSNPYSSFGEGKESVGHDRSDMKAKPGIVVSQPGASPILFLRQECSCLCRRGMFTGTCI